MHGVLFDLPRVIDGANRRLAASTVGQRCRTVAGDFFGGVPAGGDAYVLSWILHDWDDASAVRILLDCRAVLPAADGRLLVIEMIVPAPGDMQTPTSADITRLVREADLDMLVVTGGRERTLAEYDELFAKADLQASRIVALDSLPWTLIEVIPR
jgi:O-methyltransferase domain